MLGVAASNDGHVYAVGSTHPKAYKIDATNGTEVTSGWPYDHASGTSPYTGGGILFCVCTDQYGNVYVGGINNAPVRAVKLNSAGTSQWTSLVRNVVSANITGTEVRGIAINAAGTQLAASRGTESTSTMHDCYLLDPSTGSVTGGVKNGSTPSAGSMNAAAYGPLSNSYHGGANRGAVLGGPYVRKDLTTYLSSATTGICFAIAVGPDGNEFFTTGSGNTISSIIGGWTYSAGVSTNVRCMDTSHGRFGAFGL